MDSRTALALVIASSVLGCSMSSTRQRIDIDIHADGACFIQHVAVGCRQAGPQVAAVYGADRVSAVLMVHPRAPHNSVLDVRAGLQSAHITHVQSGDPAPLTSLGTGAGAG
jgi:hypothetical protein